jgi:hypothetical protein
MRKSWYVLVVVLSVCGAAIAAQTGVLEAPSYRLPGEFDQQSYGQEQQLLLNRLLAEQVAEGLVAPVTIKLTEQELREIELGRDVTSRAAASALLVGVVKPVSVTFDMTSASHGAMSRNADGTTVWSVGIHSDHAAGLRVHFENFSLPDGFEVWLYSENGGVRGPYTGTGPFATGEFWSHTVAGPDAVVQLRGNRQLSNAVRASFQMTEISHEGRDADLKSFCSYNASCIENGDCYNNSAITDAKAAVALMRYVERRRTYICSGGLVNSTANPGTPYFLTANHCIDSGTVAATLETWFQFTHPCGDDNCPEQWVWTNPSTLGATLVATNATSDFTLLQLSETPPAGSVFLGWTTEAVAYANGTELYRISHPSGAPQAYSSHKVWNPPVECTGWDRGNWIYHQDQVGATEGGSSGSPVVNASGQIVGQLSGGCGYDVYNTCNNIDNSTVDGAFAAYYDQIAAYLGGGTPCDDGDGDGYNDAACGGTDCDDGNFFVNPGVAEVCDDGIDNNCDGNIDEGCSSCPDADGDGYEDAACGGTDCDDGDFFVNPGVAEVCDDGIDNNCNGDIDGDDAACGSSCLPVGAPCSSNAECCSLRCHPRKLTCK